MQRKNRKLSLRELPKRRLYRVMKKYNVPWHIYEKMWEAEVEKVDMEKYNHSFSLRRKVRRNICTKIEKAGKEWQVQHGNAKPPSQVK